MRPDAAAAEARISFDGPSQHAGGTLTVALLADGFALPRWQADILERLQSERIIRVASVIGIDYRAGGLERLCCAVQEAVEYKGRTGRESRGAPVDARVAFPRAAVRRMDRDARVLCARDGRVEVDLVVNCGVDPLLSRTIPGRLGTLTCSFAGATSDIGLFRSFVQGGKGFSVSVSLFTGEKEIPLASAWPALPERPILHEARRNVCRRAGGLLAKAIRDLATGNSAAPPPIEACAVPPPVSLLSACRYGSRRAMQALKSRIGKLSGGGSGDPDSNWFLAYRTNPDAFVCNNERFRADGYRLVIPPPGRFYADPCVIEHDGEDHVLFEEWRADLNRGVISWMKREGDRLTPPEQVLERPYHLSYPFVFRAGTDIFMIPESGAARRIELYRAVDFPIKWEPAEVLLDGIAAADPTVLELDGRWWMFANVAEEGSSKCDQLWLFHADRVDGPWRPHRGNPVKIDVRSTRPAGRLFRRGARLIRPSQDCSTSYGGALTLCEVTRLSTAEYAEVEVEKLLPGWLPSNLGFHTLSNSDRLEVIDGKMSGGKESRFPVFEGARYAEAPA